MSWVEAKYKEVLKMPAKPLCGSLWLSGQVSHQKHRVALRLAWTAHMPDANASQGSTVPLWELVNFSKLTHNLFCPLTFKMR